MKYLKELSLLCADLPSKVARTVEIGLVGATGNDFGNTAELNVLNSFRAIRIFGGTRLYFH
jgi:hypothetical protein